MFTSRSLTEPLIVSLVVALGACTGSSSTPQHPEIKPAPIAPPTPSPLAEAYQADVNKIIEAARSDRRVWTKLEELVVHIGPRLAGSKGLEQAIAWAEAELKKDKHENVRVEKVMVPNWTRGAESLELVSPRLETLRIIGLGGTAATPPKGIDAEVLVVTSKEDLAAKASEVRGKIVLYNVVMPEYDRDKGDGYDAVYNFRNSGADWAAEHGAVAVLVRSLTTRSLSSPHTGGVRYKGAVKLPAAAITTEGATMLSLLAARGPVRLRLKLANTVGPDVESGNVIAELVGSEKPNEVVVIGAHIDSWDLGGGAHDDGGGCVVMMQALTLLRELDLRPKRTIRVVLWTNEENGLRGAIEYAKTHAASLGDHVVAMESDGGVFAPRGFLVEGKRGLEHARAIAQLLGSIRPMEVKEGFSGADLIPLVAAANVVGIGHWVEGEKYFDLHHTEADTIDKVDPQELADNVAAVAAFAYVAADMPERFGGMPPRKRPTDREP